MDSEWDIDAEAASSSHAPRRLQTRAGSKRDAGFADECLAQSSFANSEEAAEESGVEGTGKACAKFVEKSLAFQYTVAAVIFLNAMVLGLRLQYKGSVWDVTWLILGHVFCGVFAVEMVVKLAALGFAKYFWSDEGMWNLLDFSLAWIGIIEMWFVPIITSDSGRSSMSVFRLLRVIRMAKLVHANKNLSVLAEGMLASLKSLIWVACLLLVVIYAFAVALVELGSDYDTSQDSHWNPDYFGTVARSMLSLFGVCIGAEWNSIIWPLLHGEHYGKIIFFMVFVFVAQCGFLNIIVGVIVDRVNASNEAQKARFLYNQKESQMNVIRRIGGKMHEYDSDKKGGLTFEEFTGLLTDSRNQDLRRIVKRELPTGFRARDLHTLLEMDADGCLTQSEFEDGIERLISATPYQERVLVMHRQAVIHRELMEFRKEFETKVHNAVRMEVAYAVTELRAEIRQLLPASVNDLSLVAKGTTARRTDAPDGRSLISSTPTPSRPTSPHASGQHRQTSPPTSPRRACSLPAGSDIKSEECNQGLHHVLRSAKSSSDELLETLRHQAKEEVRAEKVSTTKPLVSWEAALDHAAEVERLQHNIEDVLRACLDAQGRIASARRHAQAMEIPQHQAELCYKRLLGTAEEFQKQGRCSECLACGITGCSLCMSKGTEKIREPAEEVTLWSLKASL